MLISPPTVIQSNNERLFSGMDRHSSDRDIPLDDQFIDAVISDINEILA